MIVNLTNEMATVVMENVVETNKISVKTVHVTVEILVFVSHPTFSIYTDFVFFQSIRMY